MQRIAGGAPSAGGPFERNPKAAAAKREANEGERRAKLASGVLGLDMSDMRGDLAAAGLRYID